MISLDGSDVLWTELDPQSRSASINDNQGGTTYIAVTCVNGTTQVSKVIGMLSRASNSITKIPNYVQTNTKTIYTDVSSDEFDIIPVVITNDGAERLLLAFKNGTLILRSFDQGEIWRIQIAAYSSISACGLEIEPGVFGLAFKTDTSDLYILERTTTQIRAQITTISSIANSFSLDGNSDVILMQAVSGNSGELSIYDPIKQAFIWRYISPSYFTYLKSGCFDVNNLGIMTHLVALDYLGKASLIELPSTLITGGTFPEPSIGTEWIFVQCVENHDQMAYVVLLSDGGQLIRYGWDLIKGLESIESVINDPAEIMSLDVIDQGSVYDILLNTKNNGSRVLRDNGSTITLVTHFLNYYNGSYDHQFAQIDETNSSEIILAIGNSIVMFTSEGDIIEAHSFTEEILIVKSWKVDSTEKVAFVALLQDGTLVVADPSDRIIYSLNGGATASDFRESNQSDHDQNNSESIPNEVKGLELIFPVFILNFLLFSSLLMLKQRRLNFSTIRRFIK
jgi:hypothetical protein